MQKIEVLINWWEPLIVIEYAVCSPSNKESLLFHFNNSLNHFLRSHLGIVLCTRYLSMSEECSNGVNVNPFVLQLHSKSMTKTVEGDVLSYSCLPEPSVDMYCKDAFCNHGEYLTFRFRLTQYSDGRKRQGQLNQCSRFFDTEPDICFSSTVMMYVLPSECKYVTPS